MKRIARKEWISGRQWLNENYKTTTVRLCSLRVWFVFFLSFFTKKTEINVEWRCSSLGNLCVWFIGYWSIQYSKCLCLALLAREKNRLAPLDVNKFIVGCRIRLQRMVDVSREDHGTLTTAIKMKTKWMQDEGKLDSRWRSDLIWNVYVCAAVMHVIEQYALNWNSTTTNRNAISSLPLTF